MKSPWIIPVIALAIGFPVGLLVRKQAAPPARAVPPAQSPRPLPLRPSPEAAATTARTTARDSLAACREGPRSTRLQALAALYAGLGPAGLAAEGAKLRHLPIDERFAATFLLYGRWAEAAPEAALASLNALGGGGDSFLPVVLQGWAAVDPKAAARYCLDHPSRFVALRESGGGDAPAIVAEEWAHRDPDAAVAWARTLGGEARESALADVARATVRTDPAKAWALVPEIGSGLQDQAREDVAREWAALDHASAERAIRSLPADQQARLLAAAAEGLAETDPARAAARLADLPSGARRTDAIRAVVVDEWASRQARPAAEWVMAHAAGDNPGDLLTPIMTDFVSQDAKDARAFAESLPRGRTRDWALCRYTLEAIKQDKAPFDELSSLADTIADPEIHRWAHDWLRREEAKKQQNAESSAPPKPTKPTHHIP